MDMTEASRRTDELLDTLNKGEPYVEEGLQIEAVNMHGATIGYGVILHELKWTDEIRAENKFPDGLCDKAKEILPQVQDILGRIGINGEVATWQHIDLGG